ncbi:hypothetical protein FH972_006888 [Carpinus fangiana]|uniref:Uncharacterized protein n=1 Tax=Carpinus fangiana TaxID=176857 RepID=A0A5N6QTM5_9ROSI|nr:hypothetical protein FH972_006888 [Carpinus fangiana]
MVGHGALVRVSIFDEEEGRRRDPLGPTKVLGQELEGLDDGAQEDEAENIGKGIVRFLSRIRGKERR